MLILTIDMLELPLEVFLVLTPHSHAEEWGGGEEDNSRFQVMEKIKRFLRG